MPMIVPIRNFRGMTRLRTTIDDDHRTDLIRMLATLVLNAGRQAGLHVIVVTSDDAVSSWAIDLGLNVITDPGHGLSAAASHAVSSLGDTPWMLVHADLPLVTASALRAVIAIEGTVLVPSMDGGTNVIAHRGPFPFAFGDGSFHRHLAAVPTATVLPSARLSIEIDTPQHLGGLADTGLAPSLTAS